MIRSDFREGLRGGFPIMLAASPFGALFGALAVDNGFSIADAVFMSATVYAGASQMVGIELFGSNVQPWLVVLSVFAVNFRHVLYSASLAKHIRHFSFGQKLIAFFLLVDPQYAETEQRGERGLPVSFAWYAGFGLVIYVPWIINTLIGAIFGQLIGDPKAIGLDVLLPIYFLGLVMSFRTRDRFLPIVAVSAVASVAAMHFVGSPWHVSIGALAGIVLAACLPPKRPAVEVHAVEQEA
ncbi:branched-chain amino acid ABC transporter permease [Sinorhizobium medicae]|uniref:AzlC family ABC transporter permease n=1 Tax=Sinorhizobium medicae TaxID=110321 RepID=UPI000FD6CA84|nr:AzlC family ABC transporter permease [Sinorhizobium medicae]MDX0600393.1 branched-chain amino acid ABC transporter permease [Sinorhizobium medicae]MDX0816626.1 branched-chain amino acid ABC transporter permease [Sinorhizobium medicae]MDX0861572.1 branched-chain amino acid ABC transporter permease [Sinorhizobium medicae]RVJ32879.1 branched-chain amino acid ABC transporter permease [Sinorhizobium medicae]